MDPQKVIFLDRDGVINADSPHYIKSPDEFQFLPGACQGIKLLGDHGWRVMVVTNQSGVARQYYNLDTLAAIHQKMVTGVTAAGGLIEDIFFCPHLPGSDCDCRKPKPGMLWNARDRYQLDLSHSVMVGDSARDILCGQNAGCRMTLLVLSGNGQEALDLLAVQKTTATHVVADLYEAAHLLTATLG